MSIYWLLDHSYIVLAPYQCFFFLIRLHSVTLCIFMGLNKIKTEKSMLKTIAQRAWFENVDVSLIINIL